MTLQERLAHAFPEQKRGLQARICRACKVTGPTVSAWFKLPQKVSTMELAHAEAICDTFKLDVNPRWLADGTGPMSRATDKPTTVAAVDPQLDVALRTLGKAIAASDELSRLQVGSLLEIWIHQPHRNEEIEQRIIGLLRAPAAPRQTQKTKVKEEQR